MLVGWLLNVPAPCYIVHLRDGTAQTTDINSAGNIAVQEKKKVGGGGGGGEEEGAEIP